MRLHVGIVCAEQLFRAVDSQLFGLVYEFAAAVVTLGRITLGILVGQDRALGLQHPRAGVIFRGDEFDMFFLATLLGLYGREQLVVITFYTHLFAEHRRPRNVLKWKSKRPLDGAAGRGRSIAPEQSGKSAVDRPHRQARAPAPYFKGTKKAVARANRFFRLDLGWTMGLEPTTTGITIQGSTN